MPTKTETRTSQKRKERSQNREVQESKQAARRERDMKCRDINKKYDEQIKALNAKRQYELSEVWNEWRSK